MGQVLYVIKLYRNFEESSLINIVENFNYRLVGGIGSHGSSLTLWSKSELFSGRKMYNPSADGSSSRQQRTFVHIITTLFPFII